MAAARRRAAPGPTRHARGLRGDEMWDPAFAVTSRSRRARGSTPGRSPPAPSRGRRRYRQLPGSAHQHRAEAFAGPGGAAEQTRGVPG